MAPAQAQAPQATSLGRVSRGERQMETKAEEVPSGSDAVQDSPRFRPVRAPNLRCLSAALGPLLLCQVRELQAAFRGPESKQMLCVLALGGCAQEGF